MSEEAILWLFGVLIGALFGLVGFLGRIFWNKLSALDTGALAQFVAMDREREKAWWEYRKALDADRAEKHAEVNRRLDVHSDKLASLATHETRITRIERVLNGKIS